MPRPPVLLDVPLPDFVRRQVDEICEIWPWSVLETGSAESLAMIRGLYTYAHPTVDFALVDRLEGLRVVSNFGVGVDHIDVPACLKRGIAVGNTPGAVDGATADMTLALLLAGARNLVVGDRFARGPDFSHYDPSRFLGAEVHGSTLGIVGLGRIGREVARRARGFDLRILYHNRRRDPSAESELGVEYRNLDDLLSESHFVTLNVPLTPQTQGLIGRAQLRRMRRDAILVNAARGAVVDTEALHLALTEGWIAHAALDVTEPEPLPRDHPLLALENLTIVPHLGSATVRTRQRMGEMAAANLEAGLLERELPHPVRAS